MNNITIRQAEQTDIPAMVGLLKQLFSIEADFEFDARKQAAGLELLLENKKNIVIVAEHSGIVAGMCTVQVLVSTAEGAPVGLLEDLVVHKDLRHKGIGSKLLSNICQRAKDAGLKRLQLLADKNNTPALLFYEQCGWQTTDLICLRKKKPVPPLGVV